MKRAMVKREMLIDPYEVLGLPSGKQGAKLTEKEIAKAFRAKALKLHPDKRPHDPKANAKFQLLNASYAILKDPTSRRKLDSALTKLQNYNDNKPSSSSSSSSSKTSSPSFAEVEGTIQDPRAYLIGAFLFIIAPLVFPGARAAIHTSIRIILFICLEEEAVKNKETVNAMIDRVRHFFKRDPNPPNQDSQGRREQEDDREDIQDWVFV